MAEMYTNWFSTRNDEERDAYRAGYQKSFLETGDKVKADAAGSESLAAFRLIQSQNQPAQIAQPKQVMLPQYQRKTMPFTGLEIQSFFGEKETPSQLTEQDRINSAYQPSKLTGMDYFNALSENDQVKYRNVYAQNYTPDRKRSIEEEKKLQANAMQKAMEAVESEKISAKNRSDRLALMENNDFRQDINSVMGIDAFNNRSTDEQDKIMAAWMNAPMITNRETGEQSRAGVDAIWGALNEIEEQKKYKSNIVLTDDDNIRGSSSVELTREKSEYAKTIDEYEGQRKTLEDERSNLMAQNRVLGLDINEAEDDDEREEYRKQYNANSSRLQEIEQELQTLETNWNNTREENKVDRELNAEKMEELRPQLDDVTEQLGALKAQYTEAYTRGDQEEMNRLAREMLVLQQQENNLQTEWDKLDIDKQKWNAGLNVFANTIGNTASAIVEGAESKVLTWVDYFRSLYSDYDFHNDREVQQEYKQAQQEWERLGLSDEEKAKREEAFWADIDKQAESLNQKLNALATSLEETLEDRTAKTDEYIEKAQDAVLQFMESDWQQGAFEKYNNVEKITDFLDLIEQKVFRGTGYQFGHQIDTLLLSWLSRGMEYAEVANGLSGIPARIKNLLSNPSFYASFVNEYVGDRAEAYRSNEQLTGLDKWLMLGGAALKGGIEVGFGKEASGGLEAYWANRTTSTLKSAAEESGEEVRQDFVDWARVNLGHVLQGRYEQLLPVYSPDRKDNALFNLEKDTELIVGTFVQTLGMDAMKLPLNLITKAMSGEQLSDYEKAEVEEAGRQINYAVEAANLGNDFEAAANGTEQETATNKNTVEEPIETLPEPAPKERPKEALARENAEFEAQKAEAQEAQNREAAYVPDGATDGAKHAGAVSTEDDSDYTGWHEKGGKHTGQYENQEEEYQGRHQKKAEQQGPQDSEAPYSELYRNSKRSELEAIIKLYGPGTMQRRLAERELQSRREADLDELDDNSLASYTNQEGITPQMREAAKTKLNQRRMNEAREIITRADGAALRAELEARKNGNGDPQYMYATDEMIEEELRAREENYAGIQQRAEENFKRGTEASRTYIPGGKTTGEEQNTKEEAAQKEAEQEKPAQEEQTKEEPAQEKQGKEEPEQEAPAQEEQTKEEPEQEAAPEQDEETKDIPLDDVNAAIAVKYGGYQKSIDQLDPRLKYKSIEELQKIAQQKREERRAREEQENKAKEAQPAKGEETKTPAKVTVNTPEYMDPRMLNKNKPGVPRAEKEEKQPQAGSETENYDQRELDKNKPGVRKEQKAEEQRARGETEYYDQRPLDKNKPGVPKAEQESPQQRGGNSATPENYDQRELDKNKPGVPRGKPSDETQPVGDISNAENYDQRQLDQNKPGVKKTATEETPAIKQIADAENYDQRALDENKPGVPKTQTPAETTTEPVVDIEEPDEPEQAETVTQPTTTTETEEQKTEETEETKKTREQRRIDEETEQYAKQHQFKFGPTQGDGSQDTGVHLVGTGRNISESRMRELQIIDKVAKRFGFSVEVTPEMEHNANGKYEGGRIIHINQNTENAFETVAGHEMWHMVKRVSADSAKRIESIFDKYADRTGFDTEHEIDNIIASYASQGALDSLGRTDAERRAGAKEELIANSFYSFFGDRETMRQVYAADRGVFERVMDFVRKVQQSIQEMLKTYADNTPEARMLTQQNGALEEMYQAMRETLEGMQALDETKKAAASEHGNGAMTRKYEQSVKNATSKEQITDASRELARDVLKQTGNEVNESNIQHVINAAQDVASGTQAYYALRDNMLDPSKVSEETRRGLRMLGGYYQHIMSTQDLDEWNALMMGRAKYQLDRYSDKEIENWKDSKRIVIYQNDQQMLEFIDQVTADNRDNRKIYLGKIDESVAKLALSKTGIDIKGFNVSLSGSEIRKILAGHGGQEELLSGQKPIEKSDFLDIKKTIEAPDDIILSDKQYVGRPVLIFVKNIQGKLNAVTYQSAKHKDLTVQTIYKNVKKEDLATSQSGTPVGAFSHTSETGSGTVLKGSSGDIISHQDQEVKQFSLKGPREEFSIDTELPQTKEEIYRKEQEIRDESNKLRQEIKQFEKESIDYVDRITSKDKDISEKAIKEYKSLEAKADIRGKQEKIKENNKALEKLEKQLNALKVQELNNRIEKSGLDRGEYFRKAAVNEFGYTPYFYDAGYILPNGKMLNFSGEKGKHFGMRGEDHRGISTVFEGTFETGTDALNAFVNMGNVRIMDESPGVDISLNNKLTQEQIATIRKHIRERIGERGYYVDFTDDNGRTAVSLEYDKNDKIDKILDDIAYVQKNGEAPYRSDIADFHSQYSINDERAKAGMEEYDRQMEYTGGQTEALQKLTGDLWQALALRKQQEKAENYGQWKQHVAEMARELKEQTNSAVFSEKQLEERLTKILEEHERLPHKTKEEAQNALNTTLNELQGLIQEALSDQLMDEHYKDVKAALKNGIYISPEMMKEQGGAAEARDLRNAMTGFTRVYTNEKAANAAGALHLDGHGWDELQSIDPDLFNPDTHWLERAQALRDFVDLHSDSSMRLDPMTRDYIRTQALETLAEYYSGSNETDATKRTREALKKANSKVDSLNRQLTAEIKKQGELNEQIKNLKTQARDADSQAWQERSALTSERDKLKQELQAARDNALAIGQQLNDAWQEAENLRKRLKTIDERADYLDDKIKQLKKQNIENQKAAVRDALNKNKAKAKQRAADVKARKAIKNTADELKRMVAKPTQNAYVPMDKITALNELLIAFQSGDQRRIDRTTETWMKRVRELRESSNSMTASTYDAGFEKQMQEACDILKDKGVNKLDSAELQYIADTFTEALHQIKNATKMIDRKRNTDALMEAADAIEVNEQQKGISTNSIKRMGQKFTIEQLRPKSFFNMIAGYKENAWSRVGEDFNEGQRKQNRSKQLMTDEVRGLAQGKENEKKYDKLTGKDAELIDTGYKDRNGKAIKITQAQRVSLYLHALNDDNLRHFIYGVTLPDQQLLKAGKKEQAYERSQTLKLIDQTKYRTMDEKLAALRTAISKITDGMTEYEKAWVKAYQQVMAKSTNYINETSMKLNGYEKATVENYFPIKTDRNFLQTDFESLVRDGTIEGMGMLKERVHGANPMVIEDVTDVINRMINNTSLYYGMAIPVRNFNKMYNGTLAEYEDSVKASTKRTWGNEGTQYLEKLLSDIQGNGRNEERTFLDSFRSKYASAVLTLNPSVMMKQAASLPTAAASLGWSPIMKAMGSTKKVSADLINKYTSAYIERANGGIRDMEANAQRNTAVKKGLFKLGNGIQAVDLATIKKVWLAAEFHTQENHPNLKQGTDAYYEQVARTFETAVEDTQPEYGMMQRPHILRSSNQLIRSVLMFKTQAMQNFNILYDATMNLRAKRAAYKADPSAANKAQLDQAKMNMARAASSQIVSAAVLAVMTALGKALLHKPEPYQDDKGEITAESATYQLSKDALSSMAGMLIGGNEIFDLIVGISEGKQPFDIEANSISLLNDIYQSMYKLGNAAGTIGDSSLTWEQKKEKLGKALLAFGKSSGAAYGIPLNNILNIGNSAIKYYDDIINGRGLEGLTTGDVKTTAAARYMGEALQKGDTNTYTRLYNRLLQQGKTKNQITSALKSWMKQNEPRIRQAADAIDSGDLDTYNRLINEMVKDGYGMANVVTTIETVRKAQETGESEEPRVESGVNTTLSYDEIMAAQKDEDADTYTYAQLNNLLENGNTQAARTVQSALFKTKGTTKVKSALTSYWKPKYKEAYQNRNRTELARITRLMKTMGYSDDSLKKWVTEKTTTPAAQTKTQQQSVFGNGVFGSGFGKKKSYRRSSGFGSGFGGKGFGG